MEKRPGADAAGTGMGIGMDACGATAVVSRAGMSGSRASQADSYTSSNMAISGRMVLT